MSKTPFMPLWVADFLAKTMDLDAKEIGAYMLLLMAMWTRNGSLPSDQKKLQRVARCGRDWPKIWASISHYFDDDGDVITNPRLTQELQKAATKREVNAHAGARGGRAKALKNKDAPLADATVSLQQPEPYPERVTEDGGGSACARDADHTFREQILEAMGHDKSGTTANGKQFGTQADMAEVKRWLDLPGITEKNLLAEIRRISAKRSGPPPNSFSYFQKPIQRLSGELTKPALAPLPPDQKTGASNGNSKSAERLHAFIGGAVGSSPVDRGEDSHPSQPLLARR